MKTKLFTLFLIAIIALGAVIPAFADDPGPQTPVASVAILRGSLINQPKAIDFGSHTLAGREIVVDSLPLDAAYIPGTNEPDAALLWHTGDGTGDGQGWYMNVSATDFERYLDADSNPYTGTLTTEDIIPLAGFSMQMLDTEIRPAAADVTDELPTSLFNAFTVLTDTPVKFVEAAVSEGMGEYTLNPSFKLVLPSYMKAGAYHSIVTVTIQQPLP